LNALLGALVPTVWGGGGAEVRSGVTTATGRQLRDLKKSLDAGAMTPAEHERERRKVPGKE